MPKKVKWDDSLPDRGFAAWSKASKAEKEQAIRAATAYLDGLPWKGVKLTERQALQWPRSGVFRDDGKPITGVPDEVKEATALLAGLLLLGPLTPQVLAHALVRIGHLLEDEAGFGDRDVTLH